MSTTFIHDDPQFADLLREVARVTQIDVALVEKDYWVTHCLWGLHRTGLAIWFKGGTSLSKGFGLIQRFSEDLDLMVEAGSVEGLPAVANWTSTNAGPLALRRAWYAALPAAMQIPGMRVSADATREDKQARTADYLAMYPGHFLDQLADAVSPFVRLEVGRARVLPCVAVAISSFVHDFLSQNAQLDRFVDNRPTEVRCVHPYVTLLEKLDAVSRRYGRDEIAADTFVRHYEDAVHVIRAASTLPPMTMSIRALASEMLTDKDIGRVPHPDEPALLLADTVKRAAVHKAWQRIGPMFWGPRIELEDACREIRVWLVAQVQP